MRFAARCKLCLEVSEVVITEHRITDGTDEGTPLGSSNDASSSGVWTESVRMESRPCSNAGLKRNNPHNLVQAGSGLVMTPYP